MTFCLLYEELRKKSEREGACGAKIQPDLLSCIVGGVESGFTDFDRVNAWYD